MDDEEVRTNETTTVSISDVTKIKKFINNLLRKADTDAPGKRYIFLYDGMKKAYLNYYEMLDVLIYTNTLVRRHFLDSPKDYLLNIKKFRRFVLLGECNNTSFSQKVLHLDIDVQNKGDAVIWTSTKVFSKFITEFIDFIKLKKYSKIFTFITPEKANSNESCSHPSVFLSSYFYIASFRRMFQDEIETRREVPNIAHIIFPFIQCSNYIGYKDSINEFLETKKKRNYLFKTTIDTQVYNSPQFLMFCGSKPQTLEEPDRQYYPYIYGSQKSCLFVNEITDDIMLFRYIISPSTYLNYRLVTVADNYLNELDDVHQDYLEEESYDGGGSSSRDDADQENTEAAPVDRKYNLKCILDYLEKMFDMNKDGFKDIIQVKMETYKEWLNFCIALVILDPNPRNILHKRMVINLFDKFSKSSMKSYKGLVDVNKTVDSLEKWLVSKNNVQPTAINLLSELKSVPKIRQYVRFLWERVRSDESASKKLKTVDTQSVHLLLQPKQRMLQHFLQILGRYLSSHRYARKSPNSSSNRLMGGGGVQLVHFAKTKWVDANLTEILGGRDSGIFDFEYGNGLIPKLFQPFMLNDVLELFLQSERVSDYQDIMRAAQSTSTNMQEFLNTLQKDVPKIFLDHLINFFIKINTYVYDNLSSKINGISLDSITSKINASERDVAFQDVGFNCETQKIFPLTRETIHGKEMGGAIFNGWFLGKKRTTIKKDVVEEASAQEWDDTLTEQLFE
jgi:hypothetical protein